jgi:LytS/YehU family sensor histidine kinase
MKECFTLNSKTVAFVALMGALGNLLSWLSMMVGPLVPSIPLGIYSISVALDFSLLTTFMAAFYGGSTIGGLTGLVGGLAAAYELGFSQGNIINGLGIPVGKALTGITAGFVMQLLRLQEKRKQVLTIASTLLSYIPEGIYTVFLLLIVVPFVFETPIFILIPIVGSILIKASIEMFTEGVILALLNERKSFTNLMKSFFTSSDMNLRNED